MTTRTDTAKVGELRPSQLLLSFGVGSIVDLPHLSVMVMGIDDWASSDCKEIAEERLLAAVRQDLGAQVERLRTPPMAPDTAQGPFDDHANVGVTVAPFPRWAVCTYCRLLAPLSSGLFELKPGRYRWDRTRYVHTTCNKPGKPADVVPARFLVACEAGHLDDFPWVHFVHGGPSQCKYLLRLREMGASGEIADVFVSCEKCGSGRSMAQAFGDAGARNLPACTRRWPHLRTYAEEACKAPEPRPILLGASNSWFPDLRSVLSVPETIDRLAQLVEESWPVLEKAVSVQNVQLLRQVGQLRAFAKYSDEEVWAAVEKRRGRSTESPPPEPRDLKRPEWEVFSRPDPARRSRDFQLREMKPPTELSRYFERIVLVEKLREVRALVGFTRIDSPMDHDPADAAVCPAAPISRRPPTWVPACEIRGEGIFFQFSEAALKAWEPRAVEGDRDMFQAHRSWRRKRELPPDAMYPGIRYVLLHTFAHALLRQLALECGYTAASLRERIYSSEEDGEEPMAGVLIYTAAPDSEGTLGGLVSLGEPKSLGRHLERALEGVALCASDPLCAEHRPLRDGLTLHGAACHACLFAPETFCERGNKYLDRSVLVQTIDRESMAFFREATGRGER